MTGFVDNGTDDQDEAAVAAFGEQCPRRLRGRDRRLPIQPIFRPGSSMDRASPPRSRSPRHRPKTASRMWRRLTDGRFIVVWHDDDHATSVLGRFVSATGTPLGSAFSLIELRRRQTSCRASPRCPMAALSSTSRTNDGGASGTEVEAATMLAVLARRFDSNGAPGRRRVPRQHRRSRHRPGRRRRSRPTRLTGQAFIAWEDYHAFAGARQRTLRHPRPRLPGDHRHRQRHEPATTVITDLQPRRADQRPRRRRLDQRPRRRRHHPSAVPASITSRAASATTRSSAKAARTCSRARTATTFSSAVVGRDVQHRRQRCKDTFDFNKRVRRAGVGANHDVIQGFSRAENDRIDLQDASTPIRPTGGNQAFDLIGGGGFSGTAGRTALRRPACCWATPTATASPTSRSR